MSNQLEDVKGISESFEMPGTVPQYPPSLSFKIDYMSLIIAPDLKSESNNLTNCKEILNITAIQDIKKIELDIAEIKVHSVSYSYDLYKRNSDIRIEKENTKVANFDDSNPNVPDKLIIYLPGTLKKGKSICVIITYSAGYDAEKKLIVGPRSGFYFIKPDNEYKNKPYQAWTQGEATESRYWFPCLDYPEVKIPREIHVIVPEEYTVISNGTSSKREYDDKDNSKVKKVEWIWSEDFNDSTYLTSVAIGDFAKGKGECGDIPLDYYWSPKAVKKGFDPMLTFEDTPKSIQFIQEYVHTPYPYKKYAQVAVEDFDFGGMENTSCTTLDGQMLHDHNALPNYTFDKEAVVHELAHQWFGDLVTCRDWQHIWLNEGFATYFEALYVEQENRSELTTTGIPNNDKFQYYLLTKIMDVYFNETQEYKRRLVTNLYKHPDDLFDSHSYRKGASVLHMIRNLISDEDFRESLRIYLKRHAYKSAETDDLRKILEEVSGFSLQEFFEQWVYREGHPILDIQYALLKNQIKVNIRQIKELTKDSQEDTKSKLVDEKEVFRFPLEIKLHFSNFEGKYSDVSSFDISKNKEEITIDIEDKKIKELRYISIDPGLKLLKQINTIKLDDQIYGLTLIDILRNQLEEGETSYERIQAARYIRKEPKEELISVLKNKILHDPFYGVSRECVSTLGTYARVENLKSKAYDIIKSFFERDSGNKYISEFDLRIQTTIIANLANFSKSESLKYLYPLVGHNNYFIANNVASAIGNIVSKLAAKNIISKREKEDTIQFLKEIVKKEIENESFQNQRGRGAVSALASFSDDPEEDTILDVADFLIFCSKYGNPQLLRTGAVSALGNFLRYVIKKDGKETVKFNDKVFEQLKNVIKTKRFDLQNTALTSLVRIINKIDKPDDKVMEAIGEITWIAEHDTDGWVRRVAETSLNDIRKWIRDWLKQPLKLEYKIREEREMLQEEIIQTRLSRMKLSY